MGRSYPGMSKANVNVEMRIRKGQSARVCSKISTVISGVRVGCQTFQIEKGTGALELASYEVAVPCGRKPHVEVDLLVEASAKQRVRVWKS